MKKTTILSLTTAAVILAAYVPNEPTDPSRYS
ncbi:choline binding protein PcpA [Streptococcus pneumoniae]|nr:choline binding protein PcpA [Streptococcus pneumoniae]